MINADSYEDKRTQLFFNDSPVNKNKDIALLVLIGGWVESNQHDKQLIEKLIKEPYDKWIVRIRGYRDYLVGSLDYKEHHWSISNREVLWSKYGSYLYEDNLQEFKAIFMALYTTPDPSLDLEPENRFAASVYGKEFPYSKLLSGCFIDSLMLIELHQDALSNIPLQVRVPFVSNTINELLSSADWKVWARIQNELSNLAELAPNVFFQCLSKALDDKPSPILKLFTQERSSSIGSINYLNGIVWALEVLAWEPNSLQRVVIMLAKLDLMDLNRDSNWANKPGKVLPTILLPWIANNSADFSKYIASLKALLRLNKQLAWDVGCQLLQKTNSFGTAKPKWRKWALNDAEREVPRAEAIKRYEEIGRLLVQTAKVDTARLASLVDLINNLTPPVVFEALALIESKIPELDINNKDNLWQRLSTLADKHMFFSQSDWAMATSQVEQIDKLVTSIVPSSLVVKYKHQFSYDWRGRKQFENYNDQEESLSNERKTTLREILDSSEFDTVLRLAGEVDSPYILGSTLVAVLKPSEITSKLISDVLHHPNKEFSSSILSLLYKEQPHLFPFEEASWTQEDKLALYLLLPACNALWLSLESSLSCELKLKYWREVNINPYATHIFDAQSEVAYCLKHLLEVQRYGIATNLVSQVKSHFENVMEDTLICQLLMLVAKDSDSVKIVEPRATIKLIKEVQKSKKLSLDRKSELEALYFRWISDSDNSGIEIRAVHLEERIAKEPHFFLFFLKAIYLEGDEVNESFSRLAYEVISGVKRAPGVLDDNSFSTEEFERWLQAVAKEITHLKIDMKWLRSWIGRILFYSPKTDNGLWLCDVLDILNADENSDLLEAFKTEIFCSRGVHMVDITGKEELDLAIKYRKLSDLAQLDGFYNVYPALLSAAEIFQVESKEIVSGKRYAIPESVN